MKLLVNATMLFVFRRLVKIMSLRYRPKGWAVQGTRGAIHKIYIFTYTVHDDNIYDMHVYNKEI